MGLLYPLSAAQPEGAANPSEERGLTRRALPACTGHLSCNTPFDELRVVLAGILRVDAPGRLPLPRRLGVAVYEGSTASAADY